MKRFIMGWWVGASFFLSGHAMAEAQLEEAPPGIRFEATAQSLDELTAKFQPDLCWDEDDGRFFLRASQGKTKGTWLFTLRCAYHVRQGNRTFWGFIDPKSGENLDFQHPVSQFLCLKYVREDIPCPTTDQHDGNMSFAEELAQRPDGSAVFRVQYVSLGGGRANQENIVTKLIYRSSKGQWQLAADLLPDRTYPHGWEGYSSSTTVKIIWNTGDQPAPFQAKIVEEQSTYGTGEEMDKWGYDTYREGLLGGSFPLTRTMDKDHYAISDGKLTLRSLAENLQVLQSTWVDSDWAKERKGIRETVIASWLSALQNLNPGFKADEPIQKNKHIIMPDESKEGNRIYTEIHNPQHEK